ncbi:hypothetical protein PSP6_430051 [Paraburkholderia tropica]|nr:hypothetical protein PSP6_430051 [Paraburkholderia tropica]
MRHGGTQSGETIAPSLTRIDTHQLRRDARTTPATSPNTTQARWICAEFDTSTVNCI